MKFPAQEGAGGGGVCILMKDDNKGRFGDCHIRVMWGQDVKTRQAQTLEEAGKGALGEQEPHRLTVTLPFHPEQSSV